MQVEQNNSHPVVTYTRLNLRVDRTNIYYLPKETPTYIGVLSFVSLNVKRYIFV